MLTESVAKTRGLCYNKDGLKVYAEPIHLVYEIVGNIMCD